MREHGPMRWRAMVGDCLFTAMDVEPATLIAPGYYPHGLWRAGRCLQWHGQRPVIWWATAPSR